MAELLKPKEFTVADGDGVEKTYILSKFDAVAGREIVAKYPVSMLPKIGDYDVSEETMFKLMSYVAVDVNGQPLRLTTRALINSHVSDSEALVKIEAEMMRYNCSFFRDGRLLTFFENTAQMFLQKISEILIPSSAQSSTTGKPPSTS